MAPVVVPHRIPSLPDPLQDSLLEVFGELLLPRTETDRRLEVVEEAAAIGRGSVRLRHNPVVIDVNVQSHGIVIAEQPSYDPTLADSVGEAQRYFRPELAPLEAGPNFFFRRYPMQQVLDPWSLGLDQPIEFELELTDTAFDTTCHGDILSVALLNLRARTLPTQVWFPGPAPERTVLQFTGPVTALGKPAIFTATMVLDDTLGRPLRSLRISVTDRCNIRCRYCMPEEDYVWLPRSSILSFEEIDRLVGIFTRLGVTKLRLTGGEPLLRRGLDQLVSMLSRRPEVQDLALTTNGVLLGRYAGSLKEAGLGRVTVSLDTLKEERFRQLTRNSRHRDVVEGIEQARAVGFSKIKLNAVVIRGFNDDELADLLEFARERGLEMRFIEYMDVGGATRWSLQEVVSKEEILRTLSRRYGWIEPLVEYGTSPAPAERFVLPDGTVFGVIASTTQPFCRSCDRSRLTADGMWFLCLYAERGVDLRELLRGGADDEEISSRIVEAWLARADRGAEERLQLAERRALYPLEALRADPHREMHTRGG